MGRKRKNLVGKRIGKLTVLEYSYSKRSGPVWKCSCDCGNITYVGSSNLMYSDYTKSCGCITKEKSNVIGKKFGQLTILEIVGRDKGYALLVKCKCDCGNIHTTRLYQLKNGTVKGCGCLMKKPNPNKGCRLNQHPNWNENLSEEERVESKNRAVNPKLREWREEIYKRDNFTCQKCYDNRGGNLNAHHLYSWSKYKTLRFELDNGITLCDFCHKKFHSLYHYVNNTLEQFIEFLCK